MTQQHDLDRQLNAFLREGPIELPNESFDVVRDRTEQTRQRVVIGPWRLPEMNKMLAVGLGAVAVVAVLLVGSQLFKSNIGSGGPTPTPEPTATLEPSAASPTDFDALTMGERLQDGDDVFTHMDGVQVVFTASPDWERNFPNWVVWTIDDNKATMGVTTVDNVVVDPCQPELGFQDPAVGPTIDDLVTALSDVPGLTFSAPVDVTQDGYSGVRLDYVPPDEFDNCLDDMGEAILMTLGGVEPTGSDSVIVPPNGDDAFSLYIYDVDGIRVVVAAAYTVIRTDELDEMLASIRFEQP